MGPPTNEYLTPFQGQDQARMATQRTISPSSIIAREKNQGLARPQQRELAIEVNNEQSY